MSKYNVDHTCGHAQVHQLFGPHKERDRKLAWLATTVCGVCYREQLDKQKKSDNQAAAKANALSGLPALVGSERQIAWAESIRKPVCAALAEVSLGDLSSLSGAAQQELQDALALVVNEVVRETSASWWIDNRFTLPSAGEAQYWVARTIKERGLAPTALAESVAKGEEMRS